MIKNRIVQLIFQTAYCVLAVIGFMGSLGYFDKSFNSDFYAYYTNLSNYICFGMMFAGLYFTVKSALKKEDGYATCAPTFKFLCVILIMVTFLVYNILLADDAFAYFTSLSNLLMHLILPVMFILDWILFYEHGKVKWFYPFLCTVMPLVYVIFIIIRASILKGTDAMLYPYFFLDADTLGWGGFFAWVSILVVIFVIIGFVLYFADNFRFFKEKFLNFKKRNSTPEDTE